MPSAASSTKTLRPAHVLPIEIPAEAFKRRSSARRPVAHGKSALQPLARPTLPRPSHPAPNVRDDRDTPLLWDGMAGVVGVIWARREAVYFRRHGWTTQIALIGLTKSAFSRNAFWRDLRGLRQGRLANWRGVTRVTANRCAAGHRGADDRPCRGPPGDAAMNAIAVPKSRALNWLEGFAVAAVSGG